MFVQLVKKEELTSLIVIVQPDNMMTAPEATNVTFAQFNAKPVPDLPIIVISALETESIQLIVTVHMDI